jgi:hypothetical protein
MHTFAQKPKATQQTTSAKFTIEVNRSSGRPGNGTFLVELYIEGPLVPRCPRRRPTLANGDNNAPGMDVVTVPGWTSQEHDIMF